MKKLLAFLLLCMTIVSISACTSSTYTVPKATAAKEIVSIAVSILPESPEQARTYTTEEKIDAVRSYLNSLTLSDISSEKPEDYAGMSYIISVTYDDNSKKTYNHFGNKFFKIDDQEWKLMNFEQASELEDIIANTPSD